MPVKTHVKFCCWGMEGMLICLFNAFAEINQDPFGEHSAAYWGERQRKLCCRCLFTSLSHGIYGKKAEKNNRWNVRGSVPPQWGIVNADNGRQRNSIDLILWTDEAEVRSPGFTQRGCDWLPFRRFDWSERWHLCRLSMKPCYQHRYLLDTYSFCHLQLWRKHLQQSWFSGLWEIMTKNMESFLKVWLPIKKH